MREMTITLAGRDIELKATFGAAQEIARKVADPLAIAREAILESQIGASVYQPRFAFNVENIPQILHIGAKAAGDKITLPEMQEACFEHGMMECKGYAFNFIMMLATPRSDEIATVETGDKNAGN